MDASMRGEKRSFPPAVLDLCGVAAQPHRVSVLTQTQVCEVYSISVCETGWCVWEPYDRLEIYPGCISCLYRICTETGSSRPLWHLWVQSGWDNGCMVIRIGLYWQIYLLHILCSVVVVIIMVVVVITVVVATDCKSTHWKRKWIILRLLMWTWTMIITVILYNHLFPKTEQQSSIVITFQGIEVRCSKQLK